MRNAQRPASAQEAVATAQLRCRTQDHQLHSFISLSPTALDEAKALDAEGARGRPLFGLALGVKDLLDTAGLRTTCGSAAFRDHVPEKDDVLVARAKAAGAVIVGKTNTPEFGFGALCANAICPSTANPYDLSLSSGGSSGGSAAAVAAGLVPAAIGTDFGGSVRTPAAFCGVVGLRPTAGLLPSPTRAIAWDSLPTAGLLTRDAAAAGRLLDALAGPDARDPMSWRAASSAPAALTRIAVSRDLGVAPVARDVRMRFDEAAAALSAGSSGLVEDHPDCAGAMAAFATLRAGHIHHNLSPLARKHGDKLAATVRWNIARGEGLAASAFLAAEAERSALFRRFVAFFERHDVLVTPAAAVMPFGVNSGEVTEIDGRPLESLIDYLAITAIITLTGCPALSLPYWPQGDRLPIGIQLIAAPGRDHDLLAFASALERRDGFGFRPPAAFRENFP
ncbi:amidase [Vineibacter terrae]|uniref:amidase n=1 Tax=Vineibacter terrae TaxID=2586908 RepID=UPI002E3770B8|nr:amidase [Vineibacter terrae]HEX2887338.1 amidase [Vineibacter terrae]